jgi:hypothetical protein
MRPSYPGWAADETGVSQSLGGSARFANLDNSGQKLYFSERQVDHHTARTLVTHCVTSVGRRWRRRPSLADWSK